MDFRWSSDVWPTDGISTLPGCFGVQRILPTGGHNKCPLTAVGPLSVLGVRTFASAAYRALLGEVEEGQRPMS
jgi:hypothetical protein